MAHEILGSRFMAREKAGWHRIGEVFAPDLVITAGEAMERVAGGIRFVAAPMKYDIDGVTHEAAKHRMIVRMPLPEDNVRRELGVVTDQWATPDYIGLAKALDELSKTYRVETAGVLRNGAEAFLCFRADDYTVMNDPMRSYFCANLSGTPGKTHRMLQTDVREECMNTQTTGESRATIMLNVPHSSDALQRIKLAGNLVAKFKEMQEKTKEIFESFANFHITEKEADAIFAAAYPDPQVPSQIRLLKDRLSTEEAETFKRGLTADLLMNLSVAEERYEKQRQNAIQLRSTTKERFGVFKPENLRGTAWAAYNAVTEIADWREGRNADESLLIGSRAQEKTRAFATALKLVEAN